MKYLIKPFTPTQWKIWDKLTPEERKSKEDYYDSLLEKVTRFRRETKLSPTRKREK